MGANKTKINKNVLQQLVTRTKRKRNIFKKKKDFEIIISLNSFFCLSRFTSRNKSHVRKFYLKITID